MVGTDYSCPRRIEDKLASCCVYFLSSKFFFASFFWSFPYFGHIRNCLRPSKLRRGLACLYYYYLYTYIYIYIHATQKFLLIFYNTKIIIDSPIPANIDFWVLTSKLPRFQQSASPLSGIIKEERNCQID